jgi:hypothetical protein
MEKVMRRLNGSAPGITLIVLLISLIGTGAGWAYQLRQNAIEIETIKEQFIRKEVSDMRYTLLSKAIDRMYEDNKEAHKEIYELLRSKK